MPVISSSRSASGTGLRCVSPIEFTERYGFPCTDVAQRMSEQGVGNPIHLSPRLLAHFPSTSFDMSKPFYREICPIFFGDIRDLVAQNPEAGLHVSLLATAETLELQARSMGIFFISMSLKDASPILKPFLHNRRLLSQVELPQDLLPSHDADGDPSAVHIDAEVGFRRVGLRCGLLYMDMESSLLRHQNALRLPTVGQMLNEPSVGPIPVDGHPYSGKVKAKGQYGVVSCGFGKAEQPFIESDGCFEKPPNSKVPHPPSRSSCFDAELGGYAIPLPYGVVCDSMEFGLGLGAAKLSETVLNHVQVGSRCFPQKFSLPPCRLVKVKRETLLQRSEPHTFNFIPVINLFLSPLKQEVSEVPTL